jgi:hypothetical protein
MPIDPTIVEHQYGHPDRWSTAVRVFVRMEGSYPAGSATIFQGPMIPMDGRTYMVQGKVILPNGVSVISKLLLDTRKPSLLVAADGWYINGIWYHPFEPEALQVLGVPADQTKAYSWIPNVPLDTLDQPPYLAGQPVQRKPKPWWKFW